jgi:hypothetical protein
MAPIHGRVKGVAFAPGRSDGQVRLEVVDARGHSDVVTLLSGSPGSHVSIDGVEIQDGGPSPAYAPDVLAALLWWLAHHEADVAAEVRTEEGVLVALRAAFKQAKKGATL